MKKSDSRKSDDQLQKRDLSVRNKNWLNDNNNTN